MRRQLYAVLSAAEELALIAKRELKECPYANSPELPPQGDHYWRSSSLPLIGRRHACPRKKFHHAIDSTKMIHRNAVMPCGYRHDDRERRVKQMHNYIANIKYSIVAMRFTVLIITTSIK